MNSVFLSSYRSISILSCKRLALRFFFDNGFRISVKNMICVRLATCGFSNLLVCVPKSVTIYQLRSLEGFESIDVSVYNSLRVSIRVVIDIKYFSNILVQQCAFYVLLINIQLVLFHLPFELWYIL